jgi:hypothetical protein
MVVRVKKSWGEFSKINIGKGTDSHETSSLECPYQRGYG